jgi:RecB family exonuclease
MGRAAFDWVRGVVAELRREDPLRPVTVIVPNNYAGWQLRWHLSRNGGYLGVRTLRLRQLAEALAPPRGTRLGSLLTIVEASAARQALREQGGILTNVSPTLLTDTLLDLFRDLRRAEIRPEEPFAGLDPAATASLSEVTRAALAMYQRFEQLLQSYDNPTVAAQNAAQRLARAQRRPASLRSLGALLVFRPAHVDPAEKRLLKAAERWVPVKWAPIEGREGAEGQGTGLPSPAPWPLAPDTTIMIAPDPAEEVRGVVRAIAAEVEAGLPLYQTAIVYRQGQPYAALVRDALDSAGIPWTSSEGIRLGETRAGRSLVGLLQLPESRFSRGAVLQWLATAPDLPGAVGELSSATWDRLSRAARIVRGADEWSKQLRSYAETQLTLAGAPDPEDDDDSPKNRLRRDAAHASLIADLVEALSQALGTEAASLSWTGWVAWTRDLRDRFVGSPDAGSARERPARLAVNEVLDQLKLADQIQAQARSSGQATEPVSRAEFLGGLQAALAGARLPTGRLGTGVVVEPVAAMTGLAFDRVYILGLVEGQFPPLPAPDPFFSEPQTDLLRRRREQLAKERRDFWEALDSAEGGRLILSAPESDGQRKTTPSRWLIEVASQLIQGQRVREGQPAGNPLDLASFGRLAPTTTPWLRVVRSSQEGLLRAVSAADLEDRRLQDVAHWVAASRSLADHPFAQGAEWPLKAALTLTAERWSPAFTRFDGNVSARAGQANRLRRLLAGEAISASGIQTWATCGFRFFLSRVLDLEPTQLPEDTWGIAALDRGNVIHQVLAAFFSELAQVGRPAPEERYGDDDRQRLATLARERFAKAAEDRLTGHPISWEIERERILADLLELLERDYQWRQAHGFQPALFEQPFGLGARGWPAVGIAVDNREVYLRGIIDRIDLHPTAERAYVYDYKSGSAREFAQLAEDPTVGGRHLQIALYREAVRRNLDRRDDVRGAFWFISAKEDFARKEVTGDQAQIAQRLTDVLTAVTRGMTGGAFPQIPGANDRDSFTNCRYCDFDRLCPARRGLLAERKQAAVTPLRADLTPAGAPTVTVADP